MTTASKAASKKSHHKAPPAAPALGLAERSGDGWKFTIVLGGLKVNGKKFDPQAGAELLAGMLEDGMKRITPAAGASPEKALEDLEAADAAESGDGAQLASPEPAMAPGEDGANGRH